MTTEYLLYIDRGRDRWVLQYRNQNGELIVELTDYPASIPSIVVSDAIQKSKPGSSVFAKLW
jgi:hypothetical protein